MNTKLKNLRYGLKQLSSSKVSPLIAVAAFACAFLVETAQVDYTYPLELVLKTIVKDPVILTISTK
jgi:hypothetical protein